MSQASGKGADMAKGVRFMVEFDHNALETLIAQYHLQDHREAFLGVLTIANALKCVKNPKVSDRQKGGAGIGRANLAPMAKKVEDVTEWFTRPENVNRMAAAFGDPRLKSMHPIPGADRLDAGAQAEEIAQQAIRELGRLHAVLKFTKQYDGRDGAGQRRDDILEAARCLWDFWVFGLGRDAKLWRRGGGAAPGLQFLQQSLALLGLHVSPDQIMQFKLPTGARQPHASIGTKSTDRTV